MNCSLILKERGEKALSLLEVWIMQLCLSKLCCWWPFVLFFSLSRTTTHSLSCTVLKGCSKNVFPHLVRMVSCDNNRQDKLCFFLQFCR